MGRVDASPTLPSEPVPSTARPPMTTGQSGDSRRPRPPNGPPHPKSQSELDAVGDDRGGRLEQPDIQNERMLLGVRGIGRPERGDGPFRQLCECLILDGLRQGSESCAPTA